MGGVPCIRGLRIPPVKSC
ncbi:DUF433 domain-containing protein [Acidobacteria bacterium AH-259-O06]|nr:DUF433 domain-containing protein [Acidobacteria bacterium AH-259-O06]